MLKEINLAPLWQLQNKSSYDPAKEAACKAAIQAELDEQQHRCRERILTVGRIFEILSGVETQLCISKKAMEGTKVWADPFAQKFPQSYKGSPMSTEFQAYYKNGSWRLTSICRIYCTDGHKIKITLSDTAKEAILQRMSTMW